MKAVEVFLQIAAYEPGVPVIDVLAEMNEKVGSAIDHSKLSKWRSGKLRPSPECQAYMLAYRNGEVLARLLGDAKPHQWLKLCRELVFADER